MRGRCAGTTGATNALHRYYSCVDNRAGPFRLRGRNWGAPATGTCAAVRSGMAVVSHSLPFKGITSIPLNPIRFVEIDHGDDATNSPVMVVSRQQHTDAAGGRGDMAHSAAPPPPGGYRGQPIAPARATNAWSFGNLAVEDDAPASAHTGSASTAATTVPRSPAAHVTASSPSAAAAQPAHSSAAWSAAPGVEKEHKPSKLSALFHRSGSKKAEKVTALGSADVHTHFSDKFRGRCMRSPSRFGCMMGATIQQ